MIEQGLRSVVCEQRQTDRVDRFKQNYSIDDYCEKRFEQYFHGIATVTKLPKIQLHETGIAGCIFDALAHVSIDSVIIVAVAFCMGNHHECGSDFLNMLNWLYSTHIWARTSMSRRDI